ncbi:hypothetical protein SAMN05216360_11167 [Methylobacterium phyllostachyos]|uniref:Uncharacterized protein n=1 Tax=Methylobacterium phyllostachyos TaxID=582672 RepID=A0A1H0E687_9HYPH|nr:hypothetical protein [Methylobacterium phyllostachyos]SDN77899.1 hypothetical protein SAMN05216360_11167 [Methylobacterium phyllostachyos]
MMGSDDCERVACSAEIALEILARAYHALAVVYELSNPGAYAALHVKMMPYLRDGFGPEEISGVVNPNVAMMSTALERVRCALDAVGTDVAAIRTRGDRRGL